MNDREWERKDLKKYRQKFRTRKERLLARDNAVRDLYNAWDGRAEHHVICNFLADKFYMSYKTVEDILYQRNNRLSE